MLSAAGAATWRLFRLCTGLLLLIGLAACDTDVNDGSERRLPAFGDCSIPSNLFMDGGVGKDGIPALTNPKLIGAGEAAYLAGDNRVIGLVVGGQPVAVPHNILWWHEIANLDIEGVQLAVTYCPLTGSSMAFDRATVGGGEFGVSGLLFRNNLTMYDRTAQESLWPQMNGAAGCGPRTGTALEMYPVIEMTWVGWKDLHPDTRVISSATGFNRNYTSSGYPYGDYEDRNNPQLLDRRTSIDDRRPPKERVLGIPDGEGGIAFPFGALDDETPRRVVEERVGGRAVVVFWDRDRRGVMAYRPLLDGEPLTFEVRDGRILDLATGSAWRVDGVAVSGPHAGRRLEPVAEAYVAFWFAWAAFQPETRLWEGS